MKNSLQLIIAGISGFAGSLLALALILSVTGTQATPTLQGEAPGQVSYQGYLSDSNDDPITGTVSLRFKIYNDPNFGTLLWEETQDDVEVSNGYFSVLLGSSTPLGPSVFSGPLRYLETEVDTTNIGSSYTTLSPRQKFAAVPYAYHAVEAVNATNALSATTAMTATMAPWDGITGKPEDLGGGSGGYENVIVVAKNSTGDYESVVAALDSITDSSSSNRYLVWVAPGVYTETDLVSVPEYVHLKGSGPNVTVITSTRTNNLLTSNAATVLLQNNGRVSDMTVLNEATTGYGIAIFVIGESSNTVVDNVVAEASGNGTARFAMHLSDTNATIQNSTLYTPGTGPTLRVGINGTNDLPAAAQPLISNCHIEADGNGIGVSLREFNATIQNSTIDSAQTAVQSLVNFDILIRTSRLIAGNTTASTTGSAGVRISTSRIPDPGVVSVSGNVTCLQSYADNNLETDASCDTP